MIRPDDPLADDSTISNPTPVKEVAEEAENDEPVEENEKPREDIVVTKTVEIFEYDQVTNNKVNIQVNNKEDKINSTIIIIIGAIIGVLVLIIVTMVVRVAIKKRSM